MKIAGPNYHSKLASIGISSKLIGVTSGMSSTKAFTAFQRHLLWYAEPQAPHRLTVPSALRGSLKLGYNFPISLILAILLRFTYNSALIPLRPCPIASIPPSMHRTQLESIPTNGPYTLSSLRELYEKQPDTNERNLYSRTLDKLHIKGWWEVTADKKGNISEDDLKRFQDGHWQEDVAQRRKSRLPGKGDILPFLRGGPLSVAGHSWAVKTFFDVDVYRP